MSRFSVVLLAVRTAADTSSEPRATAESHCYGQQNRPHVRPNARVGTPTTLPVEASLAVGTATLDGLHRGRSVARRVSGGELAQGRITPSTEISEWFSDDRCIRLIEPNRYSRCPAPTI